MSNMVGLNERTYHQVPDDIILLGIKKDLKPRARLMYDILMFKVQRFSRVKMYVPLADFEHWGGMDDRAVREARKELIAKRLINCERSRNGYVYHILSPSTGQPWTGPTKNYAGSVDFKSLTAEQAIKFYLHRLGDNLNRVGNQVVTMCPFCEGQETLNIKLTGGSGFNCFKCRAKGGLIDFEIEAGLRRGIEVSRSDAYTSVVAVLRHAGAIDATTDQPEAIYPYHNEDGKLLYEKVRFPGKDLKCRRPDHTDSTAYVYSIVGVRRVLYRLPRIQENDVILVLEGEKDCDRVNKLPISVLATTGPMGANHWEDSFSESLRGKLVIVMPDNDPDGRSHAQLVLNSLKGIAKDVIIREFPTGIKDAAEFLDIYPDPEVFVRLLNCEWVSEPVRI